VHPQRLGVRPPLDHHEAAAVLVHRVELAAGLGVHLWHRREQRLPDRVHVLGQRGDRGDDDDGHGASWDGGCGVPGS
jgi:hypothetical protein